MDYYFLIIFCIRQFETAFCSEQLDCFFYCHTNQSILFKTATGYLSMIVWRSKLPLLSTKWDRLIKDYQRIDYCDQLSNCFLLLLNVYQCVNLENAKKYHRCNIMWPPHWPDRDRERPAALSEPAARAQRPFRAARMRTGGRCSDLWGRIRAASTPSHWFQLFASYNGSGRVEPNTWKYITWSQAGA